MPPTSDSSPVTATVVLTGNPNCGKTTLFNALTGLRARVGNYSGVTVERKEGRLLGAPSDPPVTLLDLPGTYSLSPHSLDEQIAHDVLFQRLPDVPPPSLVVVVVDASNLERHLYFATQILELGYRTVLALNMADMAEAHGYRIDTAALSTQLGAPVVLLSANAERGVPELAAQIRHSLKQPVGAAPKSFCDLPAAFQTEIESLSARLVASSADAVTAITPDSEVEVAEARLGRLGSARRWRAVFGGSPKTTPLRVSRVEAGPKGADGGLGGPPKPTRGPRALPIPTPEFGTTPLHHAARVAPRANADARQPISGLTAPAALAASGLLPPLARAEALLLLSDERLLTRATDRYPAGLPLAVADARRRLAAAGVAPHRAIDARHARVATMVRAAVSHSGHFPETFSDRLDRVLTHRVWGMVVFFAVMALMFQCLFVLARFPMEALETGVTQLGELVGRLIPPGELHSLIEDGVVAGVGAVVVFLPQIALLFLCIGLLEDSGYMARAALLMDRLMSKVGLHGKSFIPMLSSFACAIPGILAARTIERSQARLATILIAPLIGCSARLPVYTLLTAACIPNRRVLGVANLPGLTMFGMYGLGIVAALVMAWVLKKTLLRGETPLLILELPPYQRPMLSTVLRQVWDRSWIFLRKAGTIILGINILLWFCVTYPKSPGVETDFAAQRAALQSQPAAAVANAPTVELAVTPDSSAQLSQLDQREANEKLRRTFAGWLGRAIEPVIAPLGMDWRIGIGLVTSFAAREVFVSTMSTVYNVGAGHETTGAKASLVQVLHAQQRPDGTPMYTPLLGLTLMVFYVFALQCVSTVVVVGQETHSWKWPLFQWAYLGLLAWGGAFLTCHAGRWLGW